jgi:hypothetical protein
VTLEKKAEFPLVAAALSTFMRQMAGLVGSFADDAGALAAE